MFILVGGLLISIMKNLEAKLDAIDVLGNKLIQQEKNEPLFQLKEAGVQLTGICYEEDLTEMAQRQKADEIAVALAHEEDCPRFCETIHPYQVQADVVPIKSGRILYLKGKNEGVTSLFTLKNQKDKMKNSYYELQLQTSDQLEMLQKAKIHGKDQLRQWCKEVKEFFYFKGETIELLNEKEKTAWAAQLFKKLRAKSTNHYRDDIQTTTCAYYGYCPLVSSYYKEVNGEYTNLQITFYDDEKTGKTQICIAFPFYNQVF